MGAKNTASSKETEVTAVAELESVEQFAERLVSSGLEVGLRECFIQAADIAAYLTAVRNKSMVQASRYVPGTVKAVGEKAVSGDLEAAKLLFDYLGLSVKQPVAQVATQVNINVPTLRDIIEIDQDGNVVGG